MRLEANTNITRVQLQIKRMIWWIFIYNDQVYFFDISLVEYLGKFQCRRLHLNLKDRSLISKNIWLYYHSAILFPPWRQFHSCDAKIFLRKHQNDFNLLYELIRFFTLILTNNHLFFYFIFISEQRKIHLYFFSKYKWNHLLYPLFQRIIKINDDPYSTQCDSQMHYQISE